LSKLSDEIKARTPVITKIRKHQ